MEYLLKASGLVFVLYIFYELLLKNETFFNSIRIYFLIGIVIAVLVPIIEIPIYVEAVITKYSSLDFKEASTNQTIQEYFDWPQFLIISYLIGVVFFSIKFFIQLFSLLLFISKHKIFKNDSYYFIETTKNCSPFSFFNIIIFNKSQFSEDELIQILNHEKEHVSQRHSIDTILAHLLVITLWFNPFVWLYKKAILQNLEFLADANALKFVENQKLYQLTLLKTCSTNYCTEITNNFYNSLIKKRIIMLHKNKSTNKNQFKYLLLLPILVGFVMTFNNKIVAQEISWNEENNMTVDLIIDKNSTDATLANEKSTFKKEFNIDLTFKSIKRNTENEIIAIKIDAKGETVKASFENKGNEPIIPIRITYDSNNSSISIGNISENYSAIIFDKKNNLQFNGKPNKKINYVIVNSDKEKTNWITKNNDSLSKENNIIIKSDDNVWIQKNDNDKNINDVEVIGYANNVVKIIKNGEEINIHDDNNLQFIESDDASETIFIITDGNGKIGQQKEEKVIVRNIDNTNEKPLYILDGKEITQAEMEQIKPDSIESLNVLKGKIAIEKYGDKGKNGVIEIATKQ